MEQLSNSICRLQTCSSVLGDHIPEVSPLFAPPKQRQRQPLFCSWMFAQQSWRVGTRQVFWLSGMEKTMFILKVTDLLEDHYKDQRCLASGFSAVTQVNYGLSLQLGCSRPPLWDSAKKGTPPASSHAWLCSSRPLAPD